MRWNQGRATIDKLIADGELQRVPPSREHADQGAVLRPFDRMRRTRNRSEYPSFTTPEVTADNVSADLPAATAIVETCEGVLDEMSPF
jgi:hypothetical protein